MSDNSAFSNHQLNHMILEACVENLEEALRAESLGASRIELCANLCKDGTTPNLYIIEKVLQEIQIPVKIMIRPRSGNFIYSDMEILEMINSINLCKSLKVSGVVFGALHEDMHLNIPQITRLSKASFPLEVCIHKAIDSTPDLLKSVRELLDVPGITSILSSGGSTTALEGADTLRKMVDATKGRIEIIAAGKIMKENLSLVRTEIKTSAYHGRRIVGELASNK